MSDEQYRSLMDAVSRLTKQLDGVRAEISDFRTDGLDPTLDIKQAAEKAGCHPRTIRRNVDAGKLRAMRIGLGNKRKRLRFRASDIQAWLEAQQ